MKFLGVAALCIVLPGFALAQSGFGSSDVTDGSDQNAAGSFDVTGLTPDDQTSTGKFTTAAEVGPILKMTEGNWAGVREYNGRDYVYFGHVLAWRCGLKAMKYSINEAPLVELKLPDCHMKYQQPNALIEGDDFGVYNFELGSVTSIRIDVLLDNLTTQSVTLLRENILIP